MEKDYKKVLSREVDIVFCIDATFGMGKIVEEIAGNAVYFWNDLQKIMNEKGRIINQLRTRVILFRDYIADQDRAMKVTDFLKLPEMNKDFEACLHSVIPEGGGDDPEDGLEALAYAIQSNWCGGSGRKRHIIVVLSDEGTHKLGYGKKAPSYPKGMAEDFCELSDWWGSKQRPGIMDEHAKRLIIFAPDKPGWNLIRETWNNVIHVITDDSDIGLCQISYADILHAICESI